MSQSTTQTVTGGADQDAVFAWLSDPATHQGGPVRRFDTHGAVVVLTPRHAYKVKRAVRFPFMDYATIDKRRDACRAEIEVNRRFAPDLYLAAEPITRRGDGGFVIGGEGEAVEWVVVMRRFDQEATFDRLAARGQLDGDLLADLATIVATSHAQSPIRPAGPAIESLREYLSQNRVALAGQADVFPPDLARVLCDEQDAALDRLTPLLDRRGAQGRVRRCHGDLHLRNIALIEGRPTLFDAIEFSDSVATGDVLYDLAFLLMDLMERGHAVAANRVLNRYLWVSDPCDLAGLAALPFFLALRATIRAKVVAAGVAAQPGHERDRSRSEARRYFDFARGVGQGAPPRLVAVGGLSGTGKTTLAAALAPDLGRSPGAVHLRTDVERKRLAGVSASDRLPRESYTREASDRVYARVRDMAATVLRAGFSVIVDAVHATPAEREAMADVARRECVRFDGLWLEAPAKAMLDRVDARVGDASDADADVVRAQLGHDVGSLDWTRIETGRAPADGLADARHSLGF